MAESRRSWGALIAGLIIGLTIAIVVIGKPAFDDRTRAQARLDTLYAQADKLLLSPQEQDALRNAIPDEVDRRDLQTAVLTSARGADLVVVDAGVTPLGAGNGARGAVVKVIAIGTPAQVADFATRVTSSIARRPGTSYGFATSSAPAMSVTGLDVRALPGGARVRAVVTLTAYRATNPS